MKSIRNYIIHIKNAGPASSSSLFKAAVAPQTAFHQTQTQINAHTQKKKYINK
jgi:hypothetical protein